MNCGLCQKYIKVFKKIFFWGCDFFYVYLKQVPLSPVLQSEQKAEEYDSKGRPVRQSRNKKVNYSLLEEKDDSCSESDLEEDLEKWFSAAQDNVQSSSAK